MALLSVIAARIPSALIRAPLPAHEKPRRGLEGGMRNRSAGGFGPAFYSMRRRDFKLHNWRIAARTGPVSGRALGLSRANSCG